MTKIFYVLLEIHRVICEINVAVENIDKVVDFHFIVIHCNLRICSFIY